MQAAEGGVGGGGPHVHSSGDRVGSRGGVGGVGASAHGNGVPVGEDGNILETGGGGGGGAAQYTDCRPPGHLAVVKMATLTL